MIKIFDFTKKLSDLSGEHSRLVFLLINIVIWCVASAVIAVPLCTIFIKDKAMLFTILACLIGYPGLGIGLFGGLTYLIKRS